MHRIEIWVNILWQFMASIRCNRHAILLDAKETVQTAKEQNISLIRLGDGELNIMQGIDVHYQRADPTLSKEMHTVVDYYIDHGEDSGYLLCMPNEFLQCNGLKLAKRRAWVSSWAKFRYTFKREYDVNIIYGESFLFAREYENIYSTLWKDKRLVIFVHNDRRYAEHFQKKYDLNTVYISVASQDCYKDIDETVYEIKKCIDNSNNSLEQMIVLISAGPCAKVIVYRLKDIGVQIIDTGHCWDEPLALRE